MGEVSQVCRHIGSHVLWKEARVRELTLRAGQDFHLLTNHTTAIPQAAAGGVMATGQSRVARLGVCGGRLLVVCDVVVRRLRSDLIPVVDLSRTAEKGSPAKH